MKILCTGDRQIGASTVPLADQETVAHRIADMAIEHGCGLVLDGGDIFEGPHITPEQLRAYRAPLSHLRDAGIPVVACLGNGRHDSAMRSVNGLDIFADIPGITISAHPEVHVAAGVAVATLPWVSPGRLVAARGGGDRDEINAEAAVMLLTIAAELLQEIHDTRPGLPAVLLAHWAISGASLPSGIPADMLREPVISWPDLDELGYDAIVAAHLHVPQRLGVEGMRRTLGFYVGSPQPLNHGEEGYEHGVWILDIDKIGADAWMVPIESRPFITIDADLEELLAGGVTVPLGIDGAIVRYRFTATAEQLRHIDQSAITSALRDAGAASVSIRPEVVRADRARVQGVDESLSEMDALELWLSSAQIPDDEREPLRALTRAYLEAVA